MRLQSIGASSGRNFYESIDEGEIIINSGGLTKDATTYLIKGGDIDEIISRNKRGQLTSHIKYGCWRKIYKNGRLVEQVDFRPGTNCRVIPRYRLEKSKSKIGESQCTIKRKMYGGGLRYEKVTYDNRKLSYEVKYGDSNVEVFYPTGKTWLRIKGINGDKIDFAYKASIFTEVYHNNWENQDDFNGFVRHGNYEVELFDSKGKLKIKGRGENRQKVGEWIEDYKPSFYLLGVSVSEKLFKTPDDQLDPKEVLTTISNVQLRTSLLNKIGMSKVVQKMGGKVIHTQDDMELIEIPMVRGSGWEGDEILKILKVKCPSTGVFYSLRVPPDSTNCEEARQWTFGVRNRTRNIEVGQTENNIDFINET